MSSENYQNLIVGKGEKVIAGKTHWKDFVQVQIVDHKEAFTLAMNMLRQLEANQHRTENDKSPVSFSLTGTLEPESAT